MMKELFVKISFALLEQGKSEVEVCSDWQVVDNKLGIFFISSNEKLDDSYNMSVMFNERELYQSPIRNLPEKGIKSPFQSEFMYISSRALRSEDIPFGDGMVEAGLFNGDNELVAEAIVTIEDSREALDGSSSNEAVIQENTEEVEPASNLEPIGQWGEITRLENTNIQGSIEEAEEESHIDAMEEYEQYEEKATLFSIEDTQESSEETEEESHIDTMEQSSEEVSLLVNEDNVQESSEEDEQESNMEITEQEGNNEELTVDNTFLKENLDCKTRLFKNISEYAPVNFYLNSSLEEEYISLKKNIVIEIIGCFYIAVLNDFQNRPVYFVYNGEQIIEWHNSLEEYILWMENIVGKMYNIPSSEMKTIEKLVIVTSESEQICNLSEENINWITRKEAIENLSHKYSSIVDLNMKYCTIITNDPKDTVKLNIVSEGLAIGKFIDEVDMSSITKKADSMIQTVNCEWSNCIKEILEPICERPVLFLGYAAFPAIYSTLVEGFDMASELPFVSLSWEI